jgi:hypothetical protein
MRWRADGSSRESLPEWQITGFLLRDRAKEGSLSILFSPGHRVASSPERFR